MDNTIHFDFNELAIAWGSPIVARTEIEKFSGGLLKPRTMANLDSLKKGPGKIMVGGKTCYVTKSLVAWLETRRHQSNDESEN